MFSNYSEMKVYEEDPKYQATKSYSKEDMKRFREEAAHDGFRIQELISSLPHGTGAAIQHLLRNDQLAPEELLGIEHFIVKRDTALKMAYARKVHVAFVLDVQMQLRERSQGSVCGIKTLARAAVSSSAKCAKNARLRAILATA